MKSNKYCHNLFDRCKIHIYIQLILSVEDEIILNKNKTNLLIIILLFFLRSYAITGGLPKHTLENLSADLPEESDRDNPQNSSSMQIEMAQRKTSYQGHKSIYTVPDFLKDPGNGSFQQTSNRRLLLNCKNPLHVINGSEYRYYLGIVDFFTQYECRQQLGRVLKTLKYRSTDHSTVPPDVYSERFVKFITEKTMGSV